MKDSHPINLPKSWAVTRVGEVCTDIKYGYTASASVERSGPRFLRITDIQNGQVQWGSVPYCTIEPEQIPKYALKIGDIVFARTGGTVGKSFLITSVPEESVFASYLIRLSAHAGILPKFLYYFFQSGRYWEQIGIKKGGLQGNVNATTLSSLEFPICAFAEQARIVAKIDKIFSELDNGIESLKVAREQLKGYRQAVLKHAFEGKLTASWRKENKDKLESPKNILARIQAERHARYRWQIDDWEEEISNWEATGEPDSKPSKPRKPDAVHVDDALRPVLPEGWIWERLGNLNTDVFDGPFGSNLKTSDYVNDGVRVIRLENIGYLKFLDDKVSYIAQEKYERLKKHTVRAGDIIFSSFIIDGIRLAILPDTIDRAVNKADCFCVRLHGECVRTDYAATFLSMRAAYKQIESEIHGIGRPRINTTQLKIFAIPLCGRAEQIEIMSQLSEKLSFADTIDASIEREIEKCGVLRQAILNKAFSGKLVTQDPDDEPACVLLERMRGEMPETENGKKKIRRRNAA